LADIRFIFWRKEIAVVGNHVRAGAFQMGAFQTKASSTRYHRKLSAGGAFGVSEDTMDDRVTLSLLQAARAYRARSARLLARIGLYPGQDALLKLLQDGPMTMGEAAALLSIQPPTVTKMVNRLSAAGLVRTEVMDRDRRKVAVSMTDAARDRVGEIDAIWRELEREALEDLQPEPLRTGLATIVRNLSKHNGKAAESG
jgi:DNA-binding MarR family transcriptional regulator